MCAPNDGRRTRVGSAVRHVGRALDRCSELPRELEAQGRGRDLRSSRTELKQTSLTNWIDLGREGVAACDGGVECMVAQRAAQLRERQLVDDGHCPEEREWAAVPDAEQRFGFRFADGRHDTHPAAPHGKGEIENYPDFTEVVHEVAPVAQRCRTIAWCDQLGHNREQCR